MNMTARAATATANVWRGKVSPFFSLAAQHFIGPSISCSKKREERKKKCARVCVCLSVGLNVCALWEKERDEIYGALTEWLLLLHIKADLGPAAKAKAEADFKAAVGSDKKEAKSRSSGSSSVDNGLTVEWWWWWFTLMIITHTDRRSQALRGLGEKRKRSNEHTRTR